MEVPQILYIDRAQWISRLCAGDGGSYLYEEPVCVPEACDVRVTVAAILKEKLTFKSPDEIDTAVWNPDTGSTLVRMECQRVRVIDCTANSRAW